MWVSWCSFQDTVLSAISKASSADLLGSLGFVGSEKGDSGMMDGSKPF